MAATYFFDRNEAEAQAVKGLTRQDVLDFFHRYSSSTTTSSNRAAATASGHKLAGH